MNKDLLSVVVSFFRKATVSLVVLFVFSLGLLTACEEKGPMETAGEKADQAIEETQEAMEETAEEATKDLEE